MLLCQEEYSSLLRAYRLQANSSDSSPPRTAATTSALRRITQRFVPGVGRSAIVKGPYGPQIVCRSESAMIVPPVWLGTYGLMVNRSLTCLDLKLDQIASAVEICSQLALFSLPHQQPIESVDLRLVSRVDEDFPDLRSEALGQRARHLMPSLARHISILGP
jgi:hypothetical protein